MKPRYEFHCDGKVIESNHLRELTRLAENTYLPYEIYAYYRSSTTASSGNLKMNIQNIRDASRLSEKGYSKQFIAKKFSVHPDTLSKILRQFVNQSINK
jgi:hypothetical protein